MGQMEKASKNEAAIMKKGKSCSSNGKLQKTNAKSSDIRALSRSNSRNKISEK